MAQPKQHFRWWIVAIIFLICMINYIDRSALAYAIPRIQKAYLLNGEQIGLLLAAFGIGYPFSTLIGGFLNDRFGARLVLTFSMMLWSSALVLSGLSHGFKMLLLSRILMGLSEGPCFPAITKAISQWLPKEEHGLALSLCLAAVPIALAIGGPLVSQLILAVSWQGMFIILGLTALLWTPLWCFLFRNQPEQSAFISPEELNYIQNHRTESAAAPSRKTSWLNLFRNKTYLINCWAFMIFGCNHYFFMNWLPDFFQHQASLN